MGQARNAHGRGMWLIWLCLVTFSGKLCADVAAYRAAVQAKPGLVDYYDFEDTLDDSVDGGNGLNNGVAGSPPNFVDGVDGQGSGGDFDGASNAITINRSIQDDFTVLGWVYAPEEAAASGEQYWMGHGLVYADVGGVANDFGISVNGAKLAHGIGNPDTTVLSVGDVAGPLACGWVHFAAVREVTGGLSSLRIYLNGEPSGEVTAPNVASLTATGSLTLGANAVDGRYYKGVLDEVALFGVALDEATIAALFDTAGVSNDVSQCPAPDTQCQDLTVNGPAGDKIGVYTLTAQGIDPTGDSLLYTFKAEHEDGTITLGAGPQLSDTVDFNIGKAGKWTFSVLVDDRACCPDGPNATCSQVIQISGYGFTDATGRITGDAFLALGPFLQPFGCSPGNRLLRNFIAPSKINCIYPDEGDTIDYDTNQAASTGYAGPTSPGGLPLWRTFNDGTSFDGDQNLAADTGATATNDVLTWLDTYIEYRGAGSVTADVCVGSDDSAVVYINRDLLLSDSACRGVGDCDARASYTFAPGVYRIAAAAFQGGGGWGLRLRLEVDGAPVLGDDPDWIFHGRTAPAGFTPPECSVCPTVAVQDLACVKSATRLDITWTNPPVTDPNTPTSIKINGVEVTNVPSTATSARLLNLQLPPAGTSYSVEVVHCGGVSAFCSPYGTDAEGQLLTQDFLVLGPFTHTHGCGGATSLLEGNHLAPSHIACEYPAAGDEVDYDSADPENASTGYVGPVGPTSKPVWRKFDDGTQADGDQDLTEDQGPLDNVMSWLVTYIQYSGAAPKNVKICLGSDDGGQVWINDRLLLTRTDCAGRAPCQYSVNTTIQPGTFRLAVGAWNGGGGWGSIVSLIDADTQLPIVDNGTASDWKFLGRNKPATNFSCDLKAPVVISACARNASGDLDLAWTHQEPVDSLRITADGVDVRTLPGAATSVQIAANELPASGNAIRVCVENGAQPAECCFVSPLPECFNHFPFDGTIEDDLNNNVGTFVGGAEPEPTYIDGQDGLELGAIQFDGIDDHVDIQRSIASEFTIAFWVQSEQTQAGAPGEQYWQGTGLVYADVPGGANDFGTAITGDVFAFGIGNPDTTIHSVTPVVGPGVGWKHVAATRAIDFDRSVTIIKVYVDAVLEAELELTNIAPLDASSGITIGGNAVDGRYFTGAIDDLWLCNYPLEEDEILNLMVGTTGGSRFHRGDADLNGTVQLTDAVRVLNYLFLGNGEIACQDAADSDDNGQIQLTDAVRVLNYLFLGTGEIPAPGPTDSPCGQDPTDDALTCASYPLCN